MKLSSPSFAALCFGLLIGGVAATSCGPARPVCSPSTCATGCCDSSGACVTLPSSSACGARGEQCKQCLLGQTCSFGTCMGGNTGAGTSGGGFVTSGGSAGGATGGGSAGGATGGGATGGGFGGGATGGGFGGGATGGGFGGGATGGGSGTCNTSNCTTCCQGSSCVSAPTNSACGFGGLTCSNCTSQGLVCNMVSFTCTSGTGGGAGGGGSFPGDDCTGAVPLTLVSGAASTSGSLTGYSNNTTSCSGTGPDAVYSVALPSTGTLTAQVTGFGFTPRVSIRSVCTNTTNLACDSAPVSGVATATTNQLAAGTYFVWVDSSSSTASGSYSLSVTASGAGGGSAGGAGGGFGGGGVGGGSAGYTMSSITASCDSFTTGAVDLISATTNPAISDDVTTGIFPLGLTLNFFGTPVSYGSVQTNGMIQVYQSSVGTPSAAYSNVPIPSSASPNGFIAPLWNDLYTTTGTNRAVRSKVFSDHLTIAWFDPLGSGTEFQAKLFTATGVGEFHYCNIGTDDGSSATIGAEDLNGLNGVQYMAPVATGGGVRLTP